jgi:hypothetical protein
MMKVLTALPVTALLLVAACAPGERTASDALLQFVEAVQEQEMDRLYCMSAGAAEAPELGGDESERRVGFGKWAASQYDSYIAGRNAGHVELEGHGIVEAKLFSLGKGAFYSIGEVRRVDPDTLEVEMAVRFGYSSIDLSRLSPGTTFYLCGLPLGMVHAIRVPDFPQEVTVEVLESVTLRWTLVRRPASGFCHAGWAVAAVEPLRDSAASETISWRF